MHRGRRIHDWGQSGSHMALLANVNRSHKRRKAWSTADFVPRDLRRVFAAPRGIGLTKATLHALKPLFTKDAADGK